WNYEGVGRMELRKTGINCYLISRKEPMQVDAYIYLSEKLLPYLEDEAIKQLTDAASLPGVYRRVVGMPDIHTGFGLPIGGIMATEKDGVISAGAVGMDINCGVRLLMTEIPHTEINKKHLTTLLKEIEKRIPVGVGKKSRHSGFKLEDVLKGGASFLAKKGYGLPDDLMCCEEEGCMPGANPDKVSSRAKERGDQLSTLGGGNHFMEIVYVAQVYDEHTARNFGLRQGNIAVLIHTGSRGLGHQVCTDYTEIMYKAAKRYGISLPSKGLAAVPIDSPEGKDYYGAMASATNFAFANRQLITYDVREAFCQVFNSNLEELGLKLVYDVCHNIAKFEQYDGRQLLVHRKGAVKALPPGHPGLSPRFLGTGNPVLVPGSMGNPSYVVVGTEKAKDTFYSVNHGAGRILSRTAARRNISPDELKAQIGDTLVNVDRLGKILDEAPQAYKDVEEVIDTLVVAGLTRKIVQLKPLAVIKGEE
ncbi:MAG: RtcB family protein, partial [Bacillota bacterium]